MNCWKFIILIFTDYFIYKNIYTVIIFLDFSNLVSFYKPKEFFCLVKILWDYKDLAFFIICLSASNQEITYFYPKLLEKFIYL